MHCMQEQSGRTDWQVGALHQVRNNVILTKCTKQLSAKLVIAHSTATEFLTLLVFGTNVSDIARNANVTAELLLEAPPFTLTYDNNVITSIVRPWDSVLDISAFCDHVYTYLLICILLFSIYHHYVLIACNSCTAGSTICNWLFHIRLLLLKSQCIYTLNCPTPC